MAEDGIRAARGDAGGAWDGADARQRRDELTRRAKKPPGALLRTVQRRLASFYGLDDAPDVVNFVRPIDGSGRETLLVREDDDGLELALLLPRRLLETEEASHDPDTLLQAFEGVSHFVYLAERVRTQLPTTKLELELQAEVDKFVLLALDEPALSRHDRARLRARLFEHVRFLHDAETEDGERYRLANALAARFVQRIESLNAPRELRAALRRFYRAGQTDKIHMARAA